MKEIERLRWLLLVGKLSMLGIPFFSFSSEVRNIVTTSNCMEKGTSSNCSWLILSRAVVWSGRYFKWLPTPKATQSWSASILRKFTFAKITTSLSPFRIRILPRPLNDACFARMKIRVRPLHGYRELALFLSTTDELIISSSRVLTMTTLGIWSTAEI